MRPELPATPLGVPGDRTAAALGDSCDDPALVAVLDTVLASPVPMAYAHGHDHLLLYNEPFAALLGERHPGAYGRPAADVFGPVWAVPGMGDAVRRSFAHGLPFFTMDSLVPLAGSSPEGSPDGAPPVVDGSRPPALTRGFSRVRDRDGRIAGTLLVAVETTHAVTAVDRVAALAAVLSDAVTVDDVVRATLRHGVTDLGATYVRLALQDSSRDGWVTVRASSADLADPAAERLPPLWQPLPGRSASARGTAGGGDGAWDALAPRPDVRDRVHDGQVLRQWLGDVADAIDRQVRSVALFPFRLAPGARPGRDRTGVLAYACEDVEPDAAQLLVMDGCAELVGRALRRARVLEEERSAAQLLQRSLLPDNLPQHEQLLVAARHEPGAARATVGGDFYDAFRVSDGRLALVLGDAMGQGVLASSVMGQVRSSIRAVALTDPSPRHVLRTSSDLFEGMADSSDALSAGHFVTVCYVLLDPLTGEACAASAGHLPPVLRPAPVDGVHQAPRLLELPAGPPLGIAGERPDHDFRLEVGDLLLLLTDGLVERRDESLGDSLDELLRVVAAHPDADPLALCSQLLQHYGPGTSDDVALLAAARTSGRYRTARRVLPPVASAAREGRRWLGEVLRGWDVTYRVADLEVALSELVTNAVVHARSPAEVTVRAGDGRVLVTVSDRGAHGVAQPHELPLGATRGRGLSIVADLADAWGSQRTTSGQRVWFEVAVDPGATSGLRPGG
ncbi:ATP-binding SpoIIE family protein phosphatase [Aquipuribacter sp. SD81]|uniref:ATP-binding SpoIIE family protein phosphatase n=1 Tax=Aquipuribacter sp. SD81 TaxID=3127703 RepID=UPI003017E332